MVMMIWTLMMIIWLFDASNFGEIPWTPNKFANILSIPPRSPIQFLDHHGGDEEDDHGMGDYDDLYMIGVECPSVHHKSNFLLTLFYYFNRVFLIVCRWSNLLVIDKFLSNIMMIEKFLSNCNSESRIGYLEIWKVKVSSFSLIEKFLSNANFGVLVLILKSESGNFEFD